MHEVKKIRCKKCGSNQTYLRRITNERVCRICGFVEKINIPINQVHI